ncbi:MBL fold metallo-hydrolase [Mucilaginibacter sp.]|uniref:MBL fold metallo-hydrolase n=1 Tax=Mucilaginibacter sp. TaxID=1882438 RepID=UPI000CA6EA70|nr:MBL fold metallo-hydrolase [Mucilaginibacter sp.]PLW90877.1 MAG: MBL fold hydrolase [Mucilaginibacter sp.]HEK19569.1 MBL fold metallo-hydrolase [Bacteroidota bacterium]
MEIYTLSEGSYSVDSTKKFIPFNPETDNRRDRPGSLFIHVNPFLIKTADDLILLDAGLGYKDTRDELILHQNIRNAGFEPEEVTLVLMSHLHYDHSGGLVVERGGQLLPSFPQARHVIQRQEFEFALTGTSSSYHKEIFEALQQSATIDFVDGDGEYKQGISYELSAGHSKFHQVFWMEFEGKKVFFGGDELPEPEQLIRKFVAKYDYDGHRSADLRIQYGKKAAAEGDICLFYHSRNITAGTISYNGEQFTVNTI